MFTDPQSVTIGGSATSLPRVSSGNGTGVFQTPGGEVTFAISNSYGKRNRRAIKVTSKLLVADPITPSNNIPVSWGVTLVYDSPVQGVTVAQRKDLVIALADWLKASSAANTDKFLGGEA